MWRTEATGVQGDFPVTFVSSPSIRGQSLATMKAWLPLSSPCPQLFSVPPAPVRSHPQGQCPVLALPQEPLSQHWPSSS